MEGYYKVALRRQMLLIRVPRRELHHFRCALRLCAGVPLN